MITWELAIDRYDISRTLLIMLAIKSNPKVCDMKNEMVRDFWGTP